MVYLPSEPGLNRRLMYGDYVRNRNIPYLNTRSRFSNLNTHSNIITVNDNVQNIINQTFESNITNNFNTPFRFSNRIGSTVYDLYSKSQVYNKNDVVCSICYDDDEDQTIIRKLKCGHEFHLSCIDLWLTNNKSCPICRFLV